MHTTNYYAPNGGLMRGVGQAAPATTAIVPAGGTALQTVLYVGGIAAAGALGYHGYKRNNSIGWALVWGIFGSIVWPITIPIAFAQGFGKSRTRRNGRRRRRRRG